MKEFADLEFESKESGIGVTQALMDFDNGYGVSVVSGFGVYADVEHPYEMAVLKNDEICYATDITDDVLGHLNSEDVTKYMRQVQKLLDKEYIR